MIDFTTIPNTIISIFLGYWGMYTFFHMYIYLFLADNFFDQTYPYWVFQKTDKLSWIGHVIFVVWSLPSVFLNIIFEVIYSVVTGKKIEIYKSDKIKD